MLALFSAPRGFSPDALVFLLKNHIPYFKCDLIIVSEVKSEEDRKSLVCDKRDRAITCVFCRYLHLIPTFTGPL